MDSIEPNPIINFNTNHLHDVRKTLGYEDVNKLKQDIEHLQDWIQKQNHFRVKEFEQGFLERLIIYNKGSIERTKQKLDRLCTYVNLVPEFFQNFDVKNEFRVLHGIVNMCVLPKPTKDNYRVFVTSLTGVENEVEKMNEIIDLYRYATVLGYYLMYNDYCLGYECIIDTRKFTIATIKLCNPVIIHKALTVIIDGIGQRVKRIHLISGSKFLQAVLLVIKQALSEKLKRRLVIHSNNESLYDYFPREILPNNFGGEEKSIEEFTDLDFKELCSDKHVERVKFMETIGTDESYRLSSKFNEEYSGMPGSFKSLCLD